MRTGIEDTVLSAAAKLSEGNADAVVVCSMILDKAEVIDPDKLNASVLYLIELDVLQIYGARIWTLYKDVCKEDIVSTLGMLRAHDLRVLSTAQLNHAIDNCSEGLNVEEALAEVRERLPNFGKIEPEEDDDEEQGGV